MALPPPELDVRTPIDTIQPQSEDLISDTEGLFDFIIKSLKTLADLSDSNTAGWNALAGKMAECKVKWDAWYAGFVDREQFLQKEEQWNGNGRYSYLYLTRTATKLCDALSELNDWVDALANAFALLKPGVKVTISGRVRTYTTTLEDAPVETAKMIFTVACRLLDCQRSNNFIQKGQAMTDKQLKELEKRTENAVVEEMKGDSYLQFLKKSPAHDDAKAWEKYLQTLRPQPISQVIEAMKKEQASQRGKST